MTAELTPIRKDEVDAALRAARAADARKALAELAYETLSRQAEGRAFYAAQKLVRGRAEALGISPDDAATDAGNLLAILERGAETALERALVGAFAVLGFGEALGQDDPKGASERVFRFVRHADWLEVCTDYGVYPFVDALLDPRPAEQVWSEVAQAVVDDAAGRDAEQARVRARSAARITALANATSASARAALRRVVGAPTLDEATRRLASTLAGDGAGEAEPSSPRVEGTLGRAPRARATEVVRWLSGWAIVAGALRALAFVLGARRRAQVRLGARELEVRTEVSLLGRTVRERTETWTLDALEGAGREVRYPALHLLVGAVALSVGVLFGGLMLFDGARSGELVLLLIAAALVVGGAGLDLALDVLLPARRGEVVVDLAARARPPLRIRGIGVGEADTFLRALRSRLR